MSEPTNEQISKPLNILLWIILVLMACFAAVFIGSYTWTTTVSVGDMYHALGFWGAFLMVIFSLVFTLLMMIVLGFAILVVRRISKWRWLRIPGED